MAEVEEHLQQQVTDDDKVVLEAKLLSWQTVIHHFSGMVDTDSAQVTQRVLNQARSDLLRTVHPSAATLVAYYKLLVALHPDRNGTDSAPLYQEYIKILLSAYSNTQQFTTSWWQMKSILERHYHAVR